MRNANLDDLFDAMERIAPGFEVVQSHLREWMFTATNTVADSGLHARLLVGAQLPVHQLAGSAAELDRLLVEAEVELLQGDHLIE